MQEKKNNKDKLKELRKQIETNAKKLDEFHKIILNNLQEGRDYGTITFTSKKGNEWESDRFLWKAGAERVVKLLNEKINSPELISNENKFLFKQDIHDKEGTYIGTGYGGGEPMKGINKELKMAKKRCLVDAVISANFLSGLFKQDEDIASQDEYEAVKDYAMRVAEELENPEILNDVNKGIKQGVEPERMEKWLKQLEKEKKGKDKEKQNKE